MSTVKKDDTKYHKFYQPNDIYWGIGIENETYFMKDEIEIKDGRFMKNNHKKERYCLNYWGTYGNTKLNDTMDKMFENEKTYRIPKYVNSHILSKTDINFEHKTLYVKNPPPNPKFKGSTIHEEFHKMFPELAVDYGDKYVYDGDTIEFITQSFYKTNVKSCVNELITYKKDFLIKLNKFLRENNKIRWKYPDLNYGFVIHQSNINNVSIFNSGTYHVNITMPTKLNEKGLIADISTFKKKHQSAMRLIQWIEPLLVAVYGSPDIFSTENSNYGEGSQRLLSSRYISVGTFNTLLLKEGTQLARITENSELSNYGKSWYNKIYKHKYYIKNDTIGFDFNFIKHYQCGFELRIFDYFPEIYMEQLINFIVLLLDHSLNTNCEKTVFSNKHWNLLTKTCLMKGYTAVVPKEMVDLYNSCYEFPIAYNLNAYDYLQQISDFLYLKYEKTGECVKVMSPSMEQVVHPNINKDAWTLNYIQYVPLEFDKSSPKLIRLMEAYSNMKELKKPAEGEIRLRDVLDIIGIDETVDIDIQGLHKLLLSSQV